MKKKKYDDDDGRVIANMDIEGMPWNNGYNRWFGGFAPNRYKKKLAKLNISTETNKYGEDPQLTRKETFAVMLNAIAAVLLIGGVFLVAIFLFLLFCTNVWLK